MARQTVEHRSSQDWFKLFFLFSAMAGAYALFLVTPSLSSPTLISLVITSLLSPFVASFERKGLSRNQATLALFLLLFAVIGIASYWGIHTCTVQWGAFKEKAPGEFYSAVQKMRTFEVQLKSDYSLLREIKLTDTVLEWGNQTGKWFIDHGPGLVGEFLSWLFLVPLFTFALLSEGRKLRKLYFQLVPNRFFESFFMVSSDIVTAISNYLRAKLIEALLVGLMVTVGLAVFNIPYAIVFGIIAGVTNIVPYVGPVIGAVPPVFMLLFDSQSQGSLTAVGIVFGIANMIDSVLIFPLLVANLVKLHPLVLIAVVSVGQRYYGLLGMLLSVPVAAALKVIIQEIHSFIYGTDTRSRATESHSKVSIIPS
jgi:putative permease